MVVLSGFWGTVGSILLFIVALSVLVVIHELGHFIAAKSFKVYCSDFSIGFGPKIIKIKRKKGETTFNVGIVPLGGYVSMFGEGIELPDGKEIPKERSLNGINRWKRAIIMAAGIFMNFVLAYVIFFICASCFPWERYTSNVAQIKNKEKYEAALRVTDNDGNAFQFEKNDIFQPLSYGVIVKETEKQIQTPELITFAQTKMVDGKEGQFLSPYHAEVIVDGKTVDLVFTQKYKTPKDCEDFTRTLKILEATKYDVGSLIVGYADEENKDPIYNDVEVYLPTFNDKGETKSYHIQPKEEIAVKSFVQRIIDEKPVFLDVNIKLIGKDGGGFEPLYFGANRESGWYGWKAFEVAGRQWVDSTQAVAKALGGLFAGQNWDQVGGPLAIFSQTTEILSEYSFSAYLSTWGVISVNLALFNLLPFPGLDGWQLLVTGIEGGVNVIKRSKYRKENEKRATKKNKKNNKPETENENAEVTEVVEESKRKFDKEILVKYSQLAIKIKDVEKNYFNKFNKKYNHEALLNVFSDPEADYSANEEYKYFSQHNEAVKDLDEFVLLNDLKDTKPFAEWEIPERIKNIVSYVGLGLLMILAVAILILDIIRMI